MCVCVCVYTYLFTWLYQHVGSLVAACVIWFPDHGLQPGLPHLERGVLATGPPGKFLKYSNTWLYT